MKKSALIIGIFLLSVVFTSPAFCQAGNPLLDEGIKQYQAEDLEEQ